MDDTGCAGDTANSIVLGVDEGEVAGGVDQKTMWTTDALWRTAGGAASAARASASVAATARIAGRWPPAQELSNARAIITTA